MSDQTTSAPQPPKRKLDSTVAPEPAPATGTVVMRHPETGGITTVPRSAFEGSWRYKGWEEVDVEAERDALYAQAKDLGVNVPETASGRTIVESINAHIVTNREV